MWKIILLSCACISFAASAQADDYIPSDTDVTMVTQALSLTDARIHPNEKGPDATGTLPSGARVQIDLHADGTLDDIEGFGHDTFVLSEIAGAMPHGLVLPELDTGTRILKLGLSDDGIELEGTTPDGRTFKGEFTHIGRAREWKTD